MKLDLWVHRLKDDPDSPIKFPEANLKAVFKTFGVELAVKSDGADFGEVGSNEPTDLRSYQKAFKKLHSSEPKIGDPCHFLIGRKWTGESGARVNGMLLTKQRGGVVVFTHSKDFKADGARSMLQVGHHEIGHMLNLLHGNATDSWPSAMSSAGARKGKDTQNAWAEAYKKYMKSYGLALPFSDQSAKHLKDGSDYSRLPWGADFSGAAALGFDRHDPKRKPKLTMKLLAPLGRDFRVGDPLTLGIVIHNRGRSSRRLPAYLHPRFGGVRIQIDRPGEQRPYVHIPEANLCTRRVRWLAPGGRRVRHWSTVRGPGWSALPLAGTYTIRAQMDAPHLTSRPIRIRVHAHRRAAEDAEAIRVAEYAARGAIGGGHGRPAASRSLEAATQMESRQLDVSSANLAVVRATNLAFGSAERSELLSLTRRDEVPRHLQHEAVIQAARALLDQPDKLRAMKEQAEAHFADPVMDEPLHMSLEDLMDLAEGED